MEQIELEIGEFINDLIVRDGKVVISIDQDLVESVIKELEKKVAIREDCCG